VNRFLTIRTISRGKSLGRAPVSDEILKDLKEIVEKTTDLSQQSGVPRCTCHKIIKNRLQLHLYKISVVQELQPANYQSCVQFENHLNFIIWSAENPHQFVETPLHVLKIGVWNCG
jgi:hypothetical protein